MRTQRPPAFPVGETDEEPINLSDERRFTMSWKVFTACLGIAAVAAVSWWSIKADVSDHGKQLEAISSRLTNIELDARAASNQVSEARYEQRLLKQSVDYLVNDRRGPKPPTSPTP